MYIIIIYSSESRRFFDVCLLLVCYKRSDNLVGTTIHRTRVHLPQNKLPKWHLAVTAAVPIRNILWATSKGLLHGCLLVIGAMSKWYLLEMTQNVVNLID